MNIKELAEQAGFYKYGSHFEEIIERFAELVAAAEREQCANHYLGIMRDAVEQAVLRERESCEKLCDKAAYWDGHVAANLAAAIRARGDKHE